MPAKRDKLSAAQEVFVRILADAVAEDLLTDAMDAPWIAVSCEDETDQMELARRLRAEGREVVVRSRTA
jgi:hypothetical protein